MPVILDRKSEEIWLDSEISDPDKLGGLLKPAPEKLLECYEVSVLVNSPANDVPECVAARG